MKTISIAMATYNGAEFLPAQLQSFIKQTRLPDELVVSDDASTDGTLRILEEFASKAPFTVRILQNDSKLGYAGNFNAALMQATGELVFLSDQDDVWFDSKLQRIEQLALQQPEKSLFINNAELTDASLNSVRLSKLGQIRSAGLPDTDFVMGCCVAIRRELLDHILPIPAAYPSHDDWLVRLADAMGEKYIVEDVLQYYRRHGSNQSQFIANRIDKVTHADWIRERINTNLRNSSAGMDGLNNAIKKDCLLLEGIYRLQKQVNDDMRLKKLLHNKQLLAGRINSLEKRMSFRNRARVVRIPYILTLWLSGGYVYFKGLQTALRDMLLK